MEYAYKNKFIRIIAKSIDIIGGVFFSSSKNNISSSKINKILIMKLDHLGDCFLMTPFFEDLSNKYKNVQIDIVCLEDSKQIFLNNPYINNLIGYNLPKSNRDGNNASLLDLYRLLRNIRKEKYDLFIDPRGQTFCATIGFLSGAPYRIGFAREELGGFLYSHRLEYDRSSHETEKYKLILNSMGITVSFWQPKIYLTTAEKEKISQIIDRDFSKPIIDFHIGAGEPYKRWSLYSFAEIIKKLIETKYYDIAILGGKNEVHLFEELKNRLIDSSIHNLVGQLSLRESYEFISKAHLFVGNDSLLVHMSGSFNIPTVELFNGATSLKRWQALGKNTEVLVGLDKNHSCKYDRCEYPCPNMLALTKEKVYEEIITKI